MKASLILEELHRLGVTHVVGVPDNGSRALFEALWADAGIRVILVTREGEAFAIASGLSVGGKRPLVVIQNTGLLEAGDAFRGTAYNMGLPIVALIGYRGLGGHREGGDKVDTAATFLEPTLEAWNLPYTLARSDRDIGLLSAAYHEAERASAPRAVLLGAATA